MKFAADAGPHAQQEADRPAIAFPGKYLSVTSFRADGTPAASAAFCQVERIRRNPAVLPSGDRWRQPWPTRPQVANRWPSPGRSIAWSARPVPGSPGMSATRPPPRSPGRPRTTPKGRRVSPTFRRSSTLHYVLNRRQTPASPAT